MPGQCQAGGRDSIVVIVVVVNDADSKTLGQITNIFPSESSIIFWSISYQQLACKQHYYQIRAGDINRNVSVFQRSAISKHLSLGDGEVDGEEQDDHHGQQELGQCVGSVPGLDHGQASRILQLLHGGGHHTVSLALPLLELDDDVNDDDEDDVDHVEQQPDVSQLQYGRLREGTDQGGEQRGEHQEASDGAHEPGEK